MIAHTPTSLPEAVDVLSENTDATVIAGGTDVMVDCNYRRRPIAALIDISMVPELKTWDVRDDRVQLGAGVTYTRIQRELADVLPGLASAARAVGSLQIRNRGTVGGNLATGSPAGDAIPPLVALEAVIDVVSRRGTRKVSASSFILGPKHTVLAPDELVVSITVPRGTYSEQFAKIGVRNAMVISVVSAALVLDVVGGGVRLALGSVGPTVMRTTDAERYFAGAVDLAEVRSGRPVSREILAQFGALASAAASPITDKRGTAAYRRRAVGVLAQRMLGWALDSVAVPNGHPPRHARGAAL